MVRFLLLLLVFSVQFLLLLLFVVCFGPIPPVTFLFVFLVRFSRLLLFGCFFGSIFAAGFLLLFFLGPIFPAATFFLSDFI